MAERDPRGAPQGPELFLHPASDDEPYLGSPTVVENLVRGFLGEVITFNARFNAGQIPGPEAEAGIQAEVDKLAAIFEGRTPGYRRMEWFNTPEGLGAAILRRCQYDATAADATEMLLWLTASAIIEAQDAHADDKIDDDVAKFQQDAAVDECVSALLGLPPGLMASGTSG